ncbi:uncharacterized protein C8R40DRAFT_1034807 [Lentinula edodes]|uniref:uncharacterized protein n=1 Tax=Lentinula edodes TaxID=5353 RepID=UPI001E8D5D8B|nr:uncharacterized protein C8R40DRAFT_1034807 [Lentinula edodes]KAH7880047.1 hypothetical protein C8R40DRAFT_1034807 [Lentinula edodes]
MVEYTYSVVPIPFAPLPQSHVDKHAFLRLLALKTNPECFSSTLDDESRLSAEQWRGRIDTEDRVTFIAVASEIQYAPFDAPLDPTPSSSSSSFADTSDSSKLLDDDTAKWVGLVTVLTPEFLQERWDDLPRKFRKFAMRSGKPAHVLVSMWVHPEHRHKGLGRRLISQAVDWVKNRVEKPGVEDKRGDVVLEVFKQNTGAVMLYRAMGFEDIEEVSPSIWMGRKIA